MNFTVTVVDPLLGLAELPEADRILHVLDFSLLPPADERYVVVASRGQFDEEAVAQAILADSSYIALLANKKRAQEVMRSLSAQSYARQKAGRCARSCWAGDRSGESGRDCIEHHGGDCCRAPAAGEGDTMKNP